MLRKKKRVLLKGEGLDWLQIWMAAFSLDEKGNKAIIFFYFFSLTGWFSLIHPKRLSLLQCCHIAASGIEFTNRMEGKRRVQTSQISIS